MKELVRFRNIIYYIKVAIFRKDTYPNLTVSLQLYQPISTYIFYEFIKWNSTGNGKVGRDIIHYTRAKCKSCM